MTHLILASSSPRRQELLKQVNITFTAIASNVDESQIITTDPVEKVKQLAIAKANFVNHSYPNNVILGADTVVAFQHTIFEKPTSKEEAKQMMSTLSGKIHHVYTGVAIHSNKERIVFVEKTEVEFWELTEDEIGRYIETDEPYDKAGGYGIQSLGAMFVRRINGDYYNVVGLPLSKVVRTLKRFEIYPK